MQPVGKAAERSHFHLDTGNGHLVFNWAAPECSAVAVPPVPRTNLQCRAARCPRQWRLSPLGHAGQWALLFRPEAQTLHLPELTPNAGTLQHTKPECWLSCPEHRFPSTSQHFAGAFWQHSRAKDLGKTIGISHCFFGTSSWFLGIFLLISESGNQMWPAVWSSSATLYIGVNRFLDWYWSGQLRCERLLSRCKNGMKTNSSIKS